ncbi:MFS transporter [Nocardioides mangrovicus]|uniref:MFS transporter n=1 Tax=Nocardioides mangrovicus TaxID=2478913 RepID=A0A3L8NYU7_9ACTN|nr:MFS transporter [Nocardioides mangrovicus]
MGAAGRGTGHGATYVFRQARRASHAQGAGDSGLYRIIELHAFNAAGDAALAISLAGTIFIADPGGARGPVALFLGLTMLPFAVVAPLIGPFLDRFSHGRRWAIGGTFAIRGVCCLVAADAIASNSVLLYPAALGCLVASKAYGVARAATVPRLMPEGLSLVKANSRISLAGIVGAAVSGPLAAGAASFGGQWSLRYAFVVYAAATVLSILLPARSDASDDEDSLMDGPTRTRLPSVVVLGLRCNAGLRMLSGFLTIYMAFLLTQHPLPGWTGTTFLGLHRETLLLGLVIGAAGLGNTVGIGLGNLLRAVPTRVMVVVPLVLDAAAAVCAALFYGLLFAVVLGLVAGVSQAVGKLALDAAIQRDVPERVRTSAFARSETLLQLSWVLGGFIGIALPLVPRVGLGVLAGILVLWTLFVLVARSRRVVPGVA